MMSENTFVTYQKYNTELEAVELSNLLSANGIDFLMEDSSLSFDPSFANNELIKEFRIKLKKQDFDVVDELLLKSYENQINEVDKDYYLFEFSNEELIEILAKSDEWNKHDFLLAQKILKDRGQVVNSQLLQTLRDQRMNELAKPESGHSSWIIGGYICSLLGGPLGLLIGSHLLSHKKTLPNGDIVYAYSDENRRHGKRIFILGIFVISIFIIWTVFNIINNN